MRASILIYLPLIIITSFFFILSIPAKETGKIFFEKAYSIEKKDPKSAIEYYQKAISSGLPYDLKKTALWRLYFIYKQSRSFLQAWEILSQLPHKASVENKLFEDIQYYTKIRKNEFIRLYRAIRHNQITELKQIYGYATPFLKKEILNYLLEKNQEETIRDLIYLDNHSNTIHSKLFLVSFYMERKKYDKAEQLLLEISTNYKDELTSEDKSKILYLLGKIKRKKNIVDSIPYFLLASQYTQSSREYERFLSLAMYSMYRSGNQKSAYRFKKFIYYEPNQSMRKLFFLLMEAEQNPTKKNLVSLKKMLFSIRSRSFLVEKARKLLNQYGYE